MTVPNAYVTRLSTPSIETYRHLRTASCMSDKSLDAATRGLPNTLFAVEVMLDGQTVGMGRVIYAQFGFAPTAPKSIGMRWMPSRPGPSSTK